VNMSTIDFQELKTIEQPIKDVVMGFIKEIARGDGSDGQSVPALIGTACIWHYHILYDFPPLPKLLPNPTVFNPYTSISRGFSHSAQSLHSESAPSAPKEPATYESHVPRRSSLLVCSSAATSASAPAPELSSSPGLGPLEVEVDVDDQEDLYSVNDDPFFIDSLYAFTPIVTSSDDEDVFMSDDDDHPLGGGLGDAFNPIIGGGLIDFDPEDEEVSVASDDDNASMNGFVVLDDSLYGNDVVASTTASASASV